MTDRVTDPEGDYRHPLVRRIDYLDRLIDDPDNCLDKFWYDYMTKKPLWWHLLTWPVWCFASVVRNHDDNDPVLIDNSYESDIISLLLLCMWVLPLYGIFTVLT